MLIPFFAPRETAIGAFLLFPLCYSKTDAFGSFSRYLHLCRFCFEDGQTAVAVLKHTECTIEYHH